MIGADFAPAASQARRKANPSASMPRVPDVYIREITLKSGGER
jgi:hypothetical protein